MKNKILFISMLPPISKSIGGGEQTFRFYFNKFINDDNFDVKLISCAKYRDLEYVEEELIKVDKKIVYWNNPNDKKISKIINIESKFNPLNRNANLVSNTTCISILKYLNNYIKEGFYPDVIILEWTEMVVLAPIIKRKYPNIRIVASEHDVTFIGYERKSRLFNGLKGILWKLKYKLEKNVEIKALNFCDLILPHNEEHTNQLVENGISKSKIVGLVPYYHDMSVIMRNEINNDILFFGAMHRIENILSVEWFIKNVMPLLNDLKCRFVVLGNNPQNELLSYENDRIHFTGFVQDIKPYFENSRCFVAPLILGAGIKIKVLEALSSGIPVLTNDIGIEGIPMNDNVDYYHCVTAEQYSRTIHEIWDYTTEKSNVGNNAKRKVKDCFSPESFEKVYKNKINELLER